MLANKPWTLAQQYMLVSLLVMLGGMVGIGLWISQQIETAVTNRTAAVTALYVDSYISPHLQGLADGSAESGGTESGVDVAALERLLSDTSLGTQLSPSKCGPPTASCSTPPMRLSSASSSPLKTAWLRPSTVRW